MIWMPYTYLQGLTIENIVFYNTCIQKSVDTVRLDWYLIMANNQGICSYGIFIKIILYIDTY